MAAEADILEELRRLRARVPQLTGAVAAGSDGLVLAQDTPGVDPRAVAALTTTALDLATQLTDATGQGEVRELLVRGVYGYVATYTAGRTALLTLLAQDRVNVGRLHLEGRRAGARIAELVEAATAPPAKPPAKVPAKPAIPRTRATRASRAKPAEARVPAAEPRTAAPETPAAPTAARTTES
ncbi:roadblock/LC7 domain-containing protein [Streptomyces sp. ALI-76-A]|uniref:roadblock/LC7 domain-containing protein n=1 Tax=Streptomyces sp. ALI-76-A TaxID=3025736 RepID=UPI00256EED10|nr:roadblock/LC7 domain-containing protein [Streptomyces sp. ALI-76-A]MDL5201985.1 roadblock/LC7 domain-containing protein [Streptomyces sp. ALI-76-A]